MHCLKQNIVKNFVHKFPISKALIVHYFMSEFLEIWKCDGRFCMSVLWKVFHSTKPFV